ncbi:NAD-dependent epimerase/dehydratase family protein [Pseudomonas sp. 148P]|uniref:NAD-dependent epimerase/dehydratase family protein n=1 Tax=Pseudomonas ulcerans TaxID=3115852 RepID=A0ABU7HZ18_9PSED|nr:MULTISPECIES: NAD-dependent epimerase/dehydratase family protein [unclassified Pseudomonas]MEE1922831.1 NAD-dependent epimerase/dehydratase family protein [Pseudomonas sp. 147P]MEE1936731.1 NAD-dependent epimerase/dehydratase family protein [Pseudomonas sp. 148P]
MNVSITGASGFIGRLLVDEISLLGDNVLQLSRKVENGPSFIVGDLTEASDALDQFVADADLIYHCAGEVKNASLMYELHVRGTANLLAAVQRRIRRTGQPIHWVQLSSTGAYGRQSDRCVVSESFSPAPIGDYEITKTISDEMVLALAQCEPLFSCTLIRPSIVVGATMPNRSFFQLAAMVKKRMFFYMGERNKNKSTYVHVGDVVRALILCGRDPRAVGQIFIVSNDCSQEKVIQAFASYAGVPEPRLAVSEKLVRLILKFLPSGLNLPLTSERVDALTKTGGFDSSLIRNRLDFEFLHDIPRSVPAILMGHEVESASKG